MLMKDLMIIITLNLVNNNISFSMDYLGFLDMNKIVMYFLKKLVILNMITKIFLSFLFLFIYQYSYSNVIYEK